VRKTRKIIYVDQRPYSPEALTASWLSPDPTTFRLDRRLLECQDYAFIPVTSDIADTRESLFYYSAGHQDMRWKGRQLPQCLYDLELSWPCTAKDVKRAYRELVRRAHPDGGAVTVHFSDYKLHTRKGFGSVIDL
jgi:hypothetical protein